MTERETWDKTRESLWRFFILVLAWSAYFQTFGWDTASVLVVVMYIIMVLISISVYSRTADD